MTSIKKMAVDISFKEVKTLLTLVKKRYAPSIECKKTDVNPNKLKAKAFEKLALEFYSLCGENYRDGKTLKISIKNF